MLNFKVLLNRNQKLRKDLYQLLDLKQIDIQTLNENEDGAYVLWTYITNGKKTAQLTNVLMKYKEKEFINKWYDHTLFIKQTNSQETETSQ